MKRNAPFLGVLLASSITLATLAGCQSVAPTAAGGATVKPGGQAVAPAKPTTGQTGTAQTGTNQPTPGGATVAAPKDTVTASTDLAAMLAAEREAEDYNALAGDEDKAAYTLFTLDEKGQARVAPPDGMTITASPTLDAKPVLGAARPGPGGPVADKIATAARAIAEGGLAMGRPDGKGPAMDPKARQEMMERMAKAREAAKARAEEGRKQHEARAKAEQAKAFRGKLDEKAKAELDKRQKDLREKAKDRLAKAKGNLDKARAAMKDATWVEDKAAGTKTKTFTFDVSKEVNGVTTKRSRKIVRTVRIEDNVLVSLTAEFNDVRANGGSTTTSRSKTLQADGSYKVVFHSVIVLGDGTTRTADWDKTIAADGKVSGAGKIVWTKEGAVVKTVDIKLGGSEAKETAEAKDGKETAEVVVPAEGAPEASVKDEAGKAEPVVVEAAPDGTVEVKDETAEAPAEPAAATEPAPAARA
jgi:hypothetical protein